MTTVYLKYGNYDATNALVYESPITLSALKYNPIYTREVVKYSTLRGSNIAHKLHHRKVHELTLNLIVSTDKNFVNNYFLADAQQISVDGINYYDVYIEDNELGFEYLNNNKSLPILTIRLIEVQGVA